MNMSLNKNKIGYLYNMFKDVARLALRTWVNRTFYRQLTPPSIPAEMNDDELELWLWKLRYYLQLSEPDNKTTPTPSWRWARKKLSTSSHYTIMNDEEVHDRSSSAAYSSHGSCVGKKKWAVVSTAKHENSAGSKTSFYQTIQETLDQTDWCILLVGDIDQDSSADFSFLSHNNR
jgi:hypothetical protein